MITFGSEVGPDIMMFDEVAHRMMDLMGKDQSARGVVTVEQLPDVIARLKDAIEQDKAQQRGQQPEDAGDEDAAPARVGLAQRAVPLVELLEISLARKKPVTWGI
jgi:chemotaxis protein histidine kinase CheA